MPDAEPSEVVTTVTEGRPGSHNVHGARRSVDESNSHLACGPVAHKDRYVRLAIAIEIAPLEERVHPIVPLILSLELRT